MVGGVVSHALPGTAGAAGLQTTLCKTKAVNRTLRSKAQCNLLGPRALVSGRRRDASTPYSPVCDAVDLACC